MSAKAALLDQVRDHLRSQLSRILDAAREAHASATDPDSRAESKYDTRSLEESYLAAGQSRQAEQLAEALQQLEAFEAADFELTEPVASGALVETDLEGATEWFLLLPVAGGHEVTHEGLRITLLSPESPLYQSLVGCSLGETLEGTGHMITEIA